MDERKVNGGNGVALHVRQTGPEDGPAWVFLHGYSQCGLAWDRQLYSDLAATDRLVAVDLRGHGRSDKPEFHGDTNPYGDPELWAADVAAVIAELGLRDVVLVGWSYGGAVITDYLRVHGSGAVKGVVLSGAVSVLGKAAVPFMGPEFGAMGRSFFSDDLATVVTTLDRLTELSHGHRLPDHDHYLALGYALSVPAHVRRGLFSRKLDNRDVIERLDVPLLLCHGTADEIILPAMATEHARLAPQSEIHWFEGAAHAPFWDCDDEFNEALAGFRGRL